MKKVTKTTRKLLNERLQMVLDGETPPRARIKEVRKSPDKLKSEALGEDIAQWTQELVIRTRGEDERSLKLERFMSERAKGAAERIFYEVYKAERPLTATELIRRLKMSRRTVYQVLRLLTDESWLDEMVGRVSRWQLA